MFMIDLAGDGSKENRLKNFEYLMHVLDEAEGVRDTKQGAFSFLDEGYYVRQVVVSPHIRTSIAGLKTFLVTEVLEIFEAKSKSKVSYRDIQAQLSGDMSKKYSFYYDFFDDVFDVEKNKSAFLQGCRLWQGEDEESRKHVEAGDIWLPYLLMERLREVVWQKLRKFFKLCGQETCSECEKKNEVYFQFMQAVALYEIFLGKCIQEYGTDWIEKSMALIAEMEAEMEEIGKKSRNLSSRMKQEEAAAYMQQVHLWITALDREIEEKCKPGLVYVGVFQTLKAEFGFSYTAMCYLLMVFEAMNVCGENVRGIEKTSLKIKDKLGDKYEKDLAILHHYNKKREKRYKMVNVKLEALLQEYGDTKLDEAGTIYAFMVELCKPKWDRNIATLRELERKLGYPVYKDLGGED